MAKSKHRIITNRGRQSRGKGGISAASEKKNKIDKQSQEREKRRRMYEENSYDSRRSSSSHTRQQVETQQNEVPRWLVYSVAFVMFAVVATGMFFVLTSTDRSGSNTNVNVNASEVP